MTRYLFLFFMFSMNNIYAQKDYKMIEGFYDLSSFEMASGIYLLEEETFFYYASFGNIDLKVFGAYQMNNDGLLTFTPDQKLTNEFDIYGTKNELQKDSITLFYNRPYERIAEKIVLNMGQGEVSFPEFTKEKNTVSISVKRSKSDVLIIGYDTSIPSQKENYISIQLPDDINELKIFHNYYADMVRKFVRSSFQIRDSALIDNNNSQKRSPKKEISDEIITQVKEFIADRKEDKPLEIEGKIYQKLNPVN